MSRFGPMSMLSTAVTWTTDVRALASHCQTIIKTSRVRATQQDNKMRGYILHKYFPLNMEETKIMLRTSVTVAV